MVQLTRNSTYKYPPLVTESITFPYTEGEFSVRDDDGNELVDEFQYMKMKSLMIQADSGHGRSEIYTDDGFGHYP